MDVFKAVETRRSIRKYKGQHIPDGLVNRILEAGRLAPSAANRQPWAVVAVRDPGTKQSLSIACNDCAFIANSDIFLIAIGDPSDRWFEVDAAVAMENMALVAWGEGVGSCYVGSFNEDHVKSLLHIPQNWKIVTCMTLGYPDEAPASRPRKNLQDLVFWEKYSSRGSSPPF